MPEVTIQTTKETSRVKYTFDQARTEIKNKIGIEGIKDLDAKEIQKIQGLMSDPKKPLPADFTINFDGQWFTYRVTVGKEVFGKTEIDIAQAKFIKDKGKVLDKLKEYKAATAADIAKYKKKNP